MLKGIIVPSALKFALTSTNTLRHIQKPHRIIVIVRSRDVSLKEYVIQQTKAIGILPCIKLHHKDEYIAYAQAMYDGGARVIEVTMTTPPAF